MVGSLAFETTGVVAVHPITVTRSELLPTDTSRSDLVKLAHVFVASPLLRVLLAIVGGYVLTAELVGLSAVALALFIPKAEAVILTCMIGFLAYLIILLWAFAEQRLRRVWLVLAGGIAGSYALPRIATVVVPSVQPV